MYGLAQYEAGGNAQKRLGGVANIRLEKAARANRERTSGLRQDPRWESVRYLDSGSPSASAYATPKSARES